VNDDYNMVIIKALISFLIAGTGIYVLIHVTLLARKLQGLYIRYAERQQERNSWASYLYFYNPESGERRLFGSSSGF